LLEHPLEHLVDRQRRHRHFSVCSIGGDSTGCARGALTRCGVWLCFAIVLGCAFRLRITSARWLLHIHAIAARRDATLQRDRFVEDYLKDPNPTQAAIRSGYPRKSAHLIGRRLLEDPEVLAAVEQGRAEAGAAGQSAWTREVRRLATLPVNPRTKQIKLAALALWRRALSDEFQVDGGGESGGGRSRGPKGGDDADSREPGTVLVLPDNGRGDGPVPLPPFPSLNSKRPNQSTNDSSGLQTES